VLEGWESDDKEVHSGGFCRDILDVVCCAQSQRGTGLSISLLSHGSVGACKSKGANLEASSTDSSYVIWSSNDADAHVRVYACVCRGGFAPLPACSWCLGAHLRRAELQH